MTPPPRRQAALDRIAAIRPADYARTRNHLEGAVTGLSPYITHGLVTLPDVLAGVLARGPLPVQHKLVQELGWREFFRHAWGHLGDGILASRHPGPLPDDAYARSLPADVLAGQTGVPAIDQAVRTLETTGLLHNHARMWLASYLVHLRRVHWRTGADWMVGRLLDGDLASNHLSWQWVAGTGSHKPYLFNAENVARFAPRDWHSPGTAIDRSYEELEAIARGEAPGTAPREAHEISRAAAGRGTVFATSDGGHQPGGRRVAEAPHAAPDTPPPLCPLPPANLGIPPPGPQDLDAIRGRAVWLVHPWALRPPPPDLPADAVSLGVYPQERHAAWPWTDARWRWVDAAMADVTPRRWLAAQSTLAPALEGAASVRSVNDPHISAWLQGLGCIALDPAPALLPRVERPCTSFSQWWTRASRGLRQASDLL